MKKVKFAFFAFALFAFTNNSIAQDKTNNSNIKNMERYNQLDSLHDNTKLLSVNALFEGKEGVTRSLQINKDGILAEHITKTDAILICVTGEVVYEDEKNNLKTLKAGDFYKIEPQVKHWVKGIENSQLLLIK